MAKIIIEFDSAEEQYELQYALNGAKWMSVAHEMDEWLRSRLENGHDFHNIKSALRGVWEALWHAMEKRNLHFDG